MCEGGHTGRGKLGINVENTSPKEYSRLYECVIETVSVKEVE